MSSIPVETFCPYTGDTQCESVADGKIRRCKFYRPWGGANPNTGEPVENWECDIHMNNVIALEMSALLRGNRQAVESMRDETITRQDAFLSLAQQSRRLNAN